MGPTPARGGGGAPNGPGAALKVLIAAPRRGRNSLGRAYCLWLIGRRLGWRMTTVTPADDALWPPLAESEFGQSCRTWEEPIGSHDLVIAVKMVHGSLDLAELYAKRTGTPLLLDIDEPDWESRYGYTFGQRLRVSAAMLVNRRSPLPYRRLRREAQHLVRTVSNPSLLERWPGIVVPHVRAPRPHVATSWRPGRLGVAFVGTPRSHKGLDGLRRAVSAVPGATLSVTAAPPPDALPHEEWAGTGNFEQGSALLDRSDVSVVLSDDNAFTRAQLPVKVIDAMMAGRAVVASDLPPIRWALGGTGILIKPGSVSELTAALLRLVRDEEAGVIQLGDLARRRALERFTPAAAAPGLAAAAQAALTQDHSAVRAAGSVRK